MQNSRFLPVVLGAAAGIVLMVAVVGSVALVNNQTLLTRLEALSKGQEEARTEAEEARDRQRVAEETLEAQTRRVKEMEAELAELQAQVVRAAQGRAEGRRAERGQVFAGRQSLGEGWVLLGGQGTNQGLAPVVLLDERILGNLVQSAARNLASAESPREVTVNHNYGGTPYGYTPWWPVVWAGHPSVNPTNRPPSGGVVPPATTLPPATTNPGRGGIWRPTEKPFLPNPSPWPGVTPQRSQPVFRSGVSAPRTTVSQPAQAVSVQRGGSRGAFGG